MHHLLVLGLTGNHGHSIPCFALPVPHNMAAPVHHTIASSFLFPPDMSYNGYSSCYLPVWPHLPTCNFEGCNRHQRQSCRSSNYRHTHYLTTIQKNFGSPAIQHTRLFPARHSAYSLLGGHQDIFASCHSKSCKFFCANGCLMKSRSHISCSRVCIHNYEPCLTLNPFP